MSTTTGREKLLNSLNHKSGAIPVDFGGTAVTGMHVTCIAALRNCFGLEKRPVKAVEPYQMLGLIEDDLASALELDVTGVLPPETMFGFPLKCTKAWQAPWGQELLVPEKFNIKYNGNDIYIFPQGDTGTAPSGHMPEGGFFFDAIIRQEPVDDASLDPVDNLEEFGFISDDDLDYFDREISRASETGRGIVANFGGTAFGDIALVPAPFLKHPKGIRDISEWYISTAIRRDYVRAVFDKQLEFALANLEKIHSRVGNKVDVVFICGTDFGTQTGTFCSPEDYKSLWHPYYKKLNDWIHNNTTWKTFKHSCGAVEPLLGPMIESGFDIINPVQCSATGMSPEMIKDKYGDQLVFWGGGVDTQKTLPFGSPEEVFKQVEERCRIFSRNGGFVFNAIHNIQANTPVENIIAMFGAVKACSN